ncbi:MAG: hypothetical protein NZ518_01925 [Dehalococcoidia bacterium]|nr:hypothetical protein [Dehalococcoidia bacterium]
MTTVPPPVRVPDLVINDDADLPDELGPVRSVLLAGLQGALSAFLLTHNPVSHILLFFLAPIIILAAPFVGGVAATRRAKLGVIGALFVAVCVALMNTLPIIMLMPFLFLYGDYFPDPWTGERVRLVAFVIWSGFASYSALMALAGIVIGTIKGGPPARWRA